MKQLTVKDRIDRLIKDATELTFDRCHGAAQRNIELWFYLDAQIKNKMAQAKALRTGQPVPDDLPVQSF